MNKRIDFTNNGGFPLTQYTLNLMQGSYRKAFMAFAGFVGDKVIVSGMDEVGGNVTNGWLSYGGELIPFVGGAIAADIVVTETPISRQFEDNLSHNVYFEKVAQFGGPATFAYADLVRRESILSACGEIKMWSGLIAKIPLGWALADGAVKNIADYPILFANISNVFGGDGYITFALPNLKKKFIAGYDSGDADYNTIGNAGGEKTHVLTTAEMPSRNHTVATTKSDTSTADGADPARGTITGTVNTEGGAGAAKSIGMTGGGAAHENRPPFFTLAYIIKL